MNSMIATLSSFTSQFETPLLEKAKTLFDSNAVQSLSNKDLNWNALVADSKNYKVTVRVEKNKVTDVFCACGPVVCSHITAVLYALQAKLDIKPEKFVAEQLAPEPTKIFGNKMNNLIWTSRADNSKNGELEKLGAHVSLKDTNITKLRVIVRKDLSGRQTNPIFVGAHKLMGAAIREYGKQNYTAMFDVARAVLEEICAMKAIENSALETAEAAAFMMRELFNSDDVPVSLKKEVFNWVSATWNNSSYSYYHNFLINALTSNPKATSFDDKLIALLKEFRRSSITDDPIAEGLQRLVSRQGTEDARDFMYKNLPIFRYTMIKDALERKDFVEAKKLAHEGINAGESKSKKFWEILNQIAEIENDIPAKRRYYVHTFVSSGFSETIYEECRATYSPEDWKLAYPKWIEAIGSPDSEMKRKRITRILIREESSEQLAQFLTAYPSYELALETQVFLEKTHPEVVRRVFKDFFMEYTRNAQHNAEVGLRIRSLLGTACKTAWSKKMIKELRSELLELHPTWKAFNEALGKPL